MVSELRKLEISIVKILCGTCFQNDRNSCTFVNCAKIKDDDAGTNSARERRDCERVRKKYKKFDPGLFIPFGVLLMRAGNIQPQERL